MNIQALSHTLLDSRARSVMTRASATRAGDEEKERECVPIVWRG